ncbi:MAG: ATP-binding protein [Waddliaceae bacterium]
MYSLRINRKPIQSSFATPFVSCILGPRRVGKSTFVIHYSKQHPERVWVFLNMDEMVQRTRVRNQELEAMIIEDARQKIGGEHKLWVVIDEAQKCPELFDQIKVLYDKYKDRDQIKFILTGSAILSLHKLSAESLAGRIELHYLSEFTLRESCHKQDFRVPLTSILDTIDSWTEEALHEIVRETSPFKALLEEQLEKHLLWSGLPEVLDCPTEMAKISYLNNYIQTYLEKDIRAVETITDLHLYRNLMDIIAEQTGSVREDKKIAQALGCTSDTLKKYRGYLKATLFYQDLFPYIGRTLKRIVKSPKGYLLNNGVISVLTGLNQLLVLEKSGLIGHRLENWFLNELNTWLARDPRRSNIHYWRLRSGPEVDFVVERKPNVYPFEVTCGTIPDRKKVRNLLKFMTAEPRASWGFYVYRGPYHVDTSNRIYYLPAWLIS